MNTSKIHFLGQIKLIKLIKIKKKCLSGCYGYVCFYVLSQVNLYLLMSVAFLLPSYILLQM